MRFENGNHQTEYMLADSLVELTRVCKSPSEISITSLTYKANIHRNTFYYHFKDIKALISYTIKRQFETALKNDIPIPDFFNRNSRLLAFARHEMNTDEYLNCLRGILAPAVTSPVTANLIAAATLMESQPGETISLLLQKLS